MVHRQNEPMQDRRTTGQCLMAVGSGPADCRSAEGGIADRFHPCRLVPPFTAMYHFGRHSTLVTVPDPHSAIRLRPTAGGWQCGCCTRRTQAGRVYRKERHYVEGRLDAPPSVEN
jgi:hypothetical protein